MRNGTRLALFYLMNRHGFGEIINARNIGEMSYMPPCNSNLLTNHLLVTLGLEGLSLLLYIYTYLYINIYKYKYRYLYIYIYIYK